MNTKLLNVVSLDDGRIIKRDSGGGGVTINNQSKSVDITENGTTEIVADSGYTGLGKVTINTNVASSGGGSATSVPRKAVNFIDYDGTTLYSYTKEEFLALSQLPELPTHQGLICQEWNWSLEGAQSYVRDYGKQEIGATYITDDGKTRLYIKIATRGRMDVPLYFNQTVANGVTIDWGDGSAPQTLSGTGDKNITHTYADVGEYIISLNSADGCMLSTRNNFSEDYSIFGDLVVYKNMLQAVEIGRNFKYLNSYAFYQCQNLKSVTIPKGISPYVGVYTFYQCRKLKSIVLPADFDHLSGRFFNGCSSLLNVSIPENISSFGDRSFEYCYSLTEIIIPNKGSVIPTSLFSDCTALSNIVIPNSIKNINTNAFDGCWGLSTVIFPHNTNNIYDRAFIDCLGMSFYDFSQCTSVPTLGGTTVFYSIPSDCKIVVPDALYDEWIAATNWSSYASYIVKASEFNG